MVDYDPIKHIEKLSEKEQLAEIWKLYRLLNGIELAELAENNFSVIDNKIHIQSLLCYAEHIFRTIFVPLVSENGKILNSEEKPASSPKTPSKSRCLFTLFTTFPFKMGNYKYVASIYTRT